MLHAQPAGGREVLGHLVAEDLQRALHPGAGGDRGARRAAQVGVVEVGEAVGGGAHLAAHPPLLPGQHRLVRAEPGEQRADRVAVPDDDAVHAAHLAGLGGDREPAGGADQGERGLRARGRSPPGRRSGPAR